MTPPITVWIFTNQHSSRAVSIIIIAIKTFNYYEAISSITSALLSDNFKIIIWTHDSPHAPIMYLQCFRRVLLLELGEWKEMTVAVIRIQTSTNKLHSDPDFIYCVYK